MTYVIMGIITAFNMLIIFWKFRKKRYPDAMLDMFMFLFLTSIFTTAGGMFVGMVASFVISIYLFLYPPKMPKKIQEDAEFASKVASNKTSEVYDRLRKEMYEKYGIRDKDN